MIPQPVEAAPPSVVETVEDDRRNAPSGRYPLPRVIAIANQKGGVGKTTTTINVGASLAELGQRVLIIDLDPQANASTGLGYREPGAGNVDVPRPDAGGSAGELHRADRRERAVRRPGEPRPGRRRDRVGAGVQPGDSAPPLVEAVREQFDYVLIDCPPSLGLLTVNGLSAAQEVLVPIQCEYYALEGLGQLLRNVDLVRRNLNPDLHVSTIVCVMYDARTKLADQVVTEVRDHFGDKVVDTVVPRSVRLSEAPSYGQPITTFDPRSRGALAYRDVAKEIHDESTQRIG